MKQNIKILVLSKGDEIVSNLIEFCRKEKITSAKISGIGAVSEAHLAFYRLDKKQFHRHVFSEPLEILSLSGNIAEFEQKIASHLHIVLGRDDFSLIGGHLDRATVAATCEIVIEAFSHKLIRRHDHEIGLNLIKDIK